MALGPRGMGVGVVVLRLRLFGDGGVDRVGGREIVVEVAWTAFLRFGLGLMGSEWTCVAWPFVSVFSNLIVG